MAAWWFYYDRVGRSIASLLAHQDMLAPNLLFWLEMHMVGVHEVANEHNRNVHVRSILHFHAAVAALTRPTGSDERDDAGESCD